MVEGCRWRRGRLERADSRRSEIGASPAGQGRGEVAVPRRWGYILAGLSALSGGSAIAVGKLALEDVPALAYAFYLSLFGASLPGLLLLTRPSRLHPLSMASGRILVAHTGFAFLAFWLFWAGIERMNPAVAAFLNRTEAFVTVLLGVWILNERFRPREGLGAVVALSGIFLMKLPFGGDTADPGSGPLAYWMILASSICFGTAEIFGKLAVPHFTPAAFVLYRNVLLVLVFLLAALAEGCLEWPEAQPLALIALAAVLGPIGTRFLFMASLRTIELSKASILESSQPLFTALLAGLTLGTLPGPMEWLGGMLILLGCLFLVSETWRGPSR